MPVDVFADGESMWIERLGTLRNVVRQELIGRQLDRHVRSGAVVLDVGCGQGTQAIRMALRGCTVTGVDPSPQLIDRCDADARAAGAEVELMLGHLDDLDAVLAGRRFEVVCTHGLLMYLPNARAALSQLTARLRPDGLLCQ